MRNLILKLGVATSLAMAGTAAFAGVFTQSPDPASVAQGGTVNVNFLFAGDGVTQEAQLDLTYNASVFTTVVPTVVVPGSTCGVNAMSQFIRIIPPSGAGNPLTSTATAYCSFAFTAAPAAAPANYDFTTLFIECDGPTCTRNGPFRITVTGGVTNTPPTIAYAPNFGTTITYSGAGTASPIVATPSAGSGSGAAATTTVGACTISGGGAAFPTTNINQLSFVGNTTTPQNLVLPNCVPQMAATNATLTCPETAGAGAAVNRVWTLTCPAAAPAGTPPTLTYSPAAGSSTNVAAGSNFQVDVGCPTDGAACNGSGTGNAATSRLQQLAAVYTGLASPAPSMSCNFVAEGGAVVGSPLDFVALAPDSGDIRCTCPINTTGLATENFRVDVTEISPVGGASNVRSFNVVCGAPPPACGTLNATPASGTISLANGGAASVVSTFTLTGAGIGVSNTVTCATSGVSAGTTFNVTTNPNPLTLTNNATGTVSASCTNSEQTTGTGTLTCSATSSQAGCTPPSFTFTLSCPGVSAPPPPGEYTPVPAMSEQGRILLAALVLLLGLGVVGFRMRG